MLLKDWADVAQVVQAIIQIAGLIFVIYQVNELRKTLYSTAHSNIYARYADTIRWLLDKPHLFAYFRENACLGSAPDPTVRAQVQSLCELTTTLFEHATIERHNMPSTSWRDCWLPYIADSYEQSAEMRLFFENHQMYYILEYCELIANEIAPKFKSPWEPKINNQARDRV
jgi:hypothetical protein